MAGLAAEGLQYDKVVGQSADLFTLQVCSNFHFPITKLPTNPTLIYDLNSLLPMFSSEIYKPEQATAQQRSATKSYQMGCEFHPYIIMTRLSSVPVPLAVFDELMSFNHIMGKKWCRFYLRDPSLKTTKQFMKLWWQQCQRRGPYWSASKQLRKLSGSGTGSSMNSSQFLSRISFLIQLLIVIEL